MIRDAFETMRQWTQPRAFRIKAIPFDAGDSALAAILSKPTQNTPEGIPEKTAVDLCNLCYTIESKVKHMRKDGGESEELKDIKDAHCNIKSRLKTHGIEYRDISGQMYDEGRLDLSLSERRGPGPD